VLSRWELLIDGHPLESLTVDVPEPFTALFVGRALPPAGQVDSDVIAFRDRAIGQGLRERIAVTNYGTSAVDVEIELRCDVDFADLFEVKERRVVERIERRHETTAHAGVHIPRAQASTRPLSCARTTRPPWSIHAVG
jgi:hypothetical protein